MPASRWRGMVKASQQEALLAVDLYNRRGNDRLLEAFFVHMHIAWLYLLHAECDRAGTDYRYWNAEGHLIRVDGEPKTWELHRCVENRSGLRRDFRPGNLLQASDLGKLWISPDFRPRM